MGSALSVALALGLATAPPLAAHSLEGLERTLLKREAYLAVENRPFPDFALHDAKGRIVTLAELRDKVVVLYFVFASCTDVCPLHSDLIAEVQAEVNRTPMRDEVRFVAITTDPEKDTPEVLAGYGPAHGLKPGNWVFLRSEEAQATRRLADGLGQAFKPLKDGQFLHAVVTYLIDREGRLRARYFGLKFDPTNLILHINALVNDRH